jgi:predicted Zn-ribbon and HTH transcriptional regulator
MADKKVRKVVTMKKGSRALRKVIAEKARLAGRLAPKWPHVCRRCAYRWKSKRKRPSFCSRCKSRIWNVAASVIPLKASRRRRYWVHEGAMGKGGHKLARGRMVVRVPGRRGYMSEAMARKRRRDATVKREKRAAAAKVRASVLRQAELRAAGAAGIEG